MNKKEYDLIAGVIRDRRANTWQLDELGWSGDNITACVSVIDNLAEFMAAELSKTYKNFDSEKFFAEIEKQYQGVHENGQDINQSGTSKNNFCAGEAQ